MAKIHDGTYEGGLPIPGTRLTAIIKNERGRQRILVCGPCGHGHEMTSREAKAFARWLDYFSGLDITVEDDVR